MTVVQRERVASAARAENLALTEAHWKVIELVVDHYLKYHTVSTLRTLVRQYGCDKKQLYHLFQGSPVKRVCRLTGLPVPKEC